MEDAAGKAVYASFAKQRRYQNHLDNPNEAAMTVPQPEEFRLEEVPRAETRYMRCVSLNRRPLDPHTADAYRTATPPELSIGKGTEYLHG